MEAFESVRLRWRATEHVGWTGWKSGTSWSVFLPRIALAFVFLWSGYQKVLTDLSGKMATQGFLGGSSVASGPFAGFFASLAGNWTVEVLIVSGEVAIGISLLLGLFTRAGSVAGMLMMLIFTVAMWPIADVAGGNPAVDIRVIYGLMFLMFFFLRPGLFLGADSVLENTAAVRRHPRLKLLLG